MARRSRQDEVGAWHHVMNRGLARRTVFETRTDMRMFMALIAHAVRSGRLEVHAFAILPTHFHLLVHSTSGDVGEAMRRIQNGYVRWFNRARRRDGPLFRGRYCSRRVTTESYRVAVLRYIDRNPIEARLVESVQHYPFASACAHWRGHGAPWLARSWVESLVKQRAGKNAFCFEDYSEVLHRHTPASVSSWVYQRLFSTGTADEALDSLIDAAPERVLDWMLRKAALGDGTAVGLPVCEAEHALTVIDGAEAQTGPWRLATSGPAADGWQHGRAVLLRLFCGATIDEIAARCSMSTSAVSRAVSRHARLVRGDPLYGKRLACLVSDMLATSSGPDSARRRVAAARACADATRWKDT